MDPDRLAALCRGYFKRDFTGWHDFSGRMFMLDCGGFRITYDGNFHVRITDDKVDADLEIGGVTVDRDCIEISDGGFEDHAWMLTAEREKGRPTVMSGAPLRRPIDRDRWDGTYYNRSWPEVAIARPIRMRRAMEPPGWDRDDQLQEMEFARNEATLVSVLRCEETSGLMGDGRFFRIGPSTSVHVESLMIPRDPKDLSCDIRHEGRGWHMYAYGRGKVGDRAGISDRGWYVDLLMNPYASAALEREGGQRNASTIRYLGMHPPEDLSTKELKLQHRDSGYDWTYPHEWDWYLSEGIVRI